VSLTNGARASHGVRALAVASDLTAIARRHSANMAARREIYHDSNLPNEVSGWRKLAENVGRGTTATGVHNAFMSSSAHRTHILDPAYNQIGIGAVRGSDGNLYVTEVFAARGSVHTTRVTHRHHTLTRHHPRVRAAGQRVVRVTLAVPDVSVEMLFRLLALDSEDTVRKDIALQAGAP